MRHLIPTVTALCVLAGCATFQETAVPQQTGWRARATLDMLRLYDEFGSPEQGGMLKTKDSNSREYLLSGGVSRLVYDHDGDGHPESISDQLPDGTLIFAFDADEDGRVESLSRHAGELWRFEDTNSNGIFDWFRTDFVEGNLVRVRVYLDPDEDGHFVEVETWLRPEAMPTRKSLP
jgi:hypothetical protein